MAHQILRGGGVVTRLARTTAILREANARRATQPRIIARGERAVHSAAPIWVLGLDGYWVLGGPGTRERAARMLAAYPHGTYIYGVETL